MTEDIEGLLKTLSANAWKSTRDGKPVVMLNLRDWHNLTATLARQRDDIARYTPTALQAALEAEDKFISYSVAERVLNRMCALSPAEPIRDGGA